MKKHVLAALIFVGVASCENKDTDIPKDVLPINKMKIIVWDLVQTGEYAKSLTEKDTSKKKINTAYFVQALQLHHITKPDFFKSYNFYQSHPLLNKELFDSINAYGQRQRVEMYKRRQ